uniref:DUF6343 family protein n=1 Tax=Streptomyces corallincola TaxID=2851888 RepID=UPI001FEAE982|nr:DUF6343 family protein [Streptomyces corallincola]
MRPPRSEQHGQPPVPRPRAADPGAEPVTARGDLRLRLLLAGIFLPLFAAATAGFSVWAADSGPNDMPGSGLLTVLAAVCGALALVAAVDLSVLIGRARRETAQPR